MALSEKGGVFKVGEWGKRCRREEVMSERDGVFEGGEGKTISMGGKGEEGAVSSERWKGDDVVLDVETRRICNCINGLP